MESDGPGRLARAEERMNCLTHGAGAILSVAALAALVALAAINGTTRHVLTVTAFGLSLVLVYVASTCYHACRCEHAKRRLKVLDHAAIYVLIAGTYTPFLLVLLGGPLGWTLFGVVWGLAAVGILLKLRFTGRFNLVSTIAYLAMGWIGLAAAGPLARALPGDALWLVIAGGVAYTAGTAFYLWDRLPYNHAIWHLFVMAGSAFHVAAVLRYVAMA